MKDINKIKEELLNKNDYNFSDLCNLVAVLRSPEGCPWDREQTNKSIRNAFIEETYEFIEGLDIDDNKLMCEELGDVLFQIVFHADIKKDDSLFGIQDVINGICKKMILRHPHVFSDVSVDNSAQVLVNWENIKNDEKQRQTPKMQLDSIAKSLPSLIRSQKMISKAKKTGVIKKSDNNVLFDRLYESVNALKNSTDAATVGEVLMTVCAICSNNDIDAEQSLYYKNEEFLKQID